MIRLLFSSGPLPVSLHAQYRLGGFHHICFKVMNYLTGTWLILVNEEDMTISKHFGLILSIIYRTDNEI